ncbi:MAG TPA: hypothetical protein DCX53_16055 [Anaerolineae bacterium]|nr:hypothetical protein [Anaerolineae bacterium]
MNKFGGSQEEKLRNAAEFLNAGHKKKARKLLREILSTDRNNLAGWELLLQAANNTREELFCLNRMLAIDPEHATAKQRIDRIRATGYESGYLTARGPIHRPAARKQKQQSTLLFLLLGAFIAAMCVSITGFALYRSGYIPFGSSSSLTATALAQKSASCQVLIDQAIQVSGSYCDDTSSNKVCYGNINIMADLAADATQRFSERGDIIAVNELRRLSASPLNLDSNEWGIAVFKIIANLPRSLPGETITMVVFGNATLDNDSGDSENLESFYFSSELGQISCEKVPFDGLMVTSPDGSGVTFNINGAELTLIGDASIKAIKNGEMEVSLYRGSARIVSNGQEQYFGAGQKVSIELGGEKGDRSISVPSEPEPLSEEELAIACTMTGQFCSESEITPVSEEQAQGEIQSGITSTPSIVPTRTLSLTPSSTVPATNTLLVLPSSTGSPGPTPLPTKSKTPGPTKTPGPSLTPSRTSTPTRTSTPSRTNTPTSTNTPTNTSTNTATNTPSNTPSPTFTPGGPSEPICGSVSLSAITNPNPNELSMDITNSSGGTITIDRFFAYWVDSPSTQALDMLVLNSDLIWNQTDNNSPSDFPTEGNWRSGSDRTIPNATTRTFVVQYRENLQSTGYVIHIIFDIGCRVTGSK